MAAWMYLFLNLTVTQSSHQPNIDLTLSHQPNIGLNYKLSIALRANNALAFYTGLLQLPEDSSRVVELSGGEKRRVSLVVALMHNPPLLILDEPTTGVDPLVRESIWSHLTHLTRAKGTTVIITTHYMDSARHADTVGVMRRGKLMVEKSPKELLLEQQENSLEAVVLKLCKADSRLKTKNTNLEIGLNVNQLSSPSSTSASQQSFTALEFRRESCLTSLAGSGARTRALLKKNTYFWQLSIGMLLMSIFFPAGGLLVTYFCFDDPKYVHLGVVNEEISATGFCEELRTIWTNSCDATLWSCKYLNQLRHPEFTLVMLRGSHDYDSVGMAEEGLHLGEIRGFIYFPTNFSLELFLRSVDPNGAGSGLGGFSGSSIVVRLDKSNSIISQIIEFGLHNAFYNFLREILGDCSLDLRQGEPSLNYKEPLMGKDLTRSHFTTPPFLIMTMFFFPIITTGVQLVSEKRAGTLQRSVVSGVQPWEIFLSYFIAETLISFLRMAFMYASATLLIRMNISGSLLLEAGLGLLMGWVGISFGFLLGSICSEEVQVALIGLAIYLPNFVLSGMLWPLEGMPEILQKIAYLLPCTLPSEGMRSMVNRGWGIENGNVWPGFVSAGAYILVVFFGVVVVSMRNKSSKLTEARNCVTRVGKPDQILYFYFYATNSKV